MKETNKKVLILLPKGYKPCAFDILCGRGRSNARHPGNKMFSDIVKQSVPRYIQGRNRTNRRIIVERIVEHIEQQGFRFIKVLLDTKTQRYYQLDSDAVHEKVGHAIRDLIKLNELKEASNKKCRVVSPICSLNTIKSGAGDPLSTVSPDASHQEDYENRSSRKDECIVWQQEQNASPLFLDEERVAFANLAMSIELRQFPDTTTSTMTAYHDSMDLAGNHCTETTRLDSGGDLLCPTSEFPDWCY